MPYRCPYCSYTRGWKLRRGAHKCKRCRREFRSCEYPVSGFRLTEHQWRNCLHVFLRERTASRVSEDVGVSLKSAQKMTHHLRLVMLEDIPPVFCGPVEMDETYVGGQRKNKRLHIRKIYHKPGHGTQKLPIVGLFCRSSGQVRVTVESKKLDIKGILDLVHEQVTPGASMYTDGFKMYRGLSRHGYTHAYVNHSLGEYVRGDVHTNNIEGFWGILKRRLGCIGGMRRERLPLFVAEITWKFNHRKLSLTQQEECLYTRLTED